MQEDRIYRFDQETEWRFGLTLPKLGKSGGVAFLAAGLFGGTVQGLGLIALLIAVMAVTYMALAAYERLVPRNYVQNLYYYVSTPMILDVTNDSHPLPLAVPRDVQLDVRRAPQRRSVPT